jgi:hypothetical protein
MLHTNLDVLCCTGKAYGLFWYHTPILDGHAPNILPEGFTSEELFEGKWPIIFRELHAALDQNEGVVVDCKGDLGRARTVDAVQSASVRLDQPDGINDSHTNVVNSPALRIPTIQTSLTPIHQHQCLRVALHAQSRARRKA